MRSLIADELESTPSHWVAFSSIVQRATPRCRKDHILFDVLGNGYPLDRLAAVIPGRFRLSHWNQRCVGQGGMA